MNFFYIKISTLWLSPLLCCPVRTADALRHLRKDTTGLLKVLYELQVVAVFVLLVAVFVLFVAVFVLLVAVFVVYL